jgi:hypothetical protein
MSTALQMQGRFSAIADISKAYIQISAGYVRPAIDKMESLSTASEANWERESAGFLKWCEDATQEIDQLARGATENVDKNIAHHINALHRKALMAAEESEE